MAKQAVMPVQNGDVLVRQEPRRYTEVKTALLMSVPFFASLLLDMMTVKIGKFAERGIPTAGTDGRTIWVDKDFLNSLSIHEAVFLFCHEIGHAMWQHMPRAKRYTDLGFDGQKFVPMAWNMAGDYVINAMLVEAKIGTMPKHGLLDHQFDGKMQVDDVYRKIMQQTPPPQPQDCSQQSGNQEGDGDGDPSSGNGGQAGKPQMPAGKDLLDQHVTPTDPAINEHEWKRAVESAASAAKSQGKMPAGLARVIEQLLDPQVPWADQLQMELSRVFSRDTTTWTRPHKRRLIVQEVYLPAYTGYAVGEVVVAVDTSGSIGPDELKVFLSEVEGILSTCNPEKVWLLGADARVDTVVELERGDSLVGAIPELGGGGGTNFRPVFEWVRDEGVNPSTLIYLTDMYGSFPDEAPEYPVIWCATSDIEGPFGRTLHINLAERNVT